MSTLKKKYVQKYEFVYCCLALGAEPCRAGEEFVRPTNGLVGRSIHGDQHLPNSVFFIALFGMVYFLM